MRERQAAGQQSASQNDVNPPSNKEFYDRNNINLVKTKDLKSSTINKSPIEHTQPAPNFERSKLERLRQELQNRKGKNTNLGEVKSSSDSVLNEHINQSTNSSDEISRGNFLNLEKDH